MIQSIGLSQMQPTKLVEMKSVQEASPAQLTQSFGQFLQTALEGVSAQEQQVHKLNDNYMIGQVDISQVLIASEQAKLSLQFTSEVRNKVISAYQEIMRIQI